MDKMVYDKLFIPAVISMEQDIAMLMNATDYVCSFKPTIESPQQHNLRLSIWSKKRGKTNVGLVVSFLCGVSIALFTGMLFADLESLDKSYVIIIALVFGVLAFLRVLVSFSAHEKGGGQLYSLKIDNTNCHNYQLRMLTDKKLYIICNPNFDHGNSVMSGNFIAEVTPQYSDLIILDELKFFEENDAGIHIRATTTIKSYDPDKEKDQYTQAQSSVVIDLFIQRGIYPKELLEACMKHYYITYKINMSNNLDFQLPPSDIYDISFPSDDNPKLAMCKHFYTTKSKVNETKLTQIFKDEFGHYFMVQFLRGTYVSNSLNGTQKSMFEEDLERVKDKKWGYYFVNRFKAGYIDWYEKSGEAKVVHLMDFTLKERDEEINKYSYKDSNGVRTINIANSYEGLAEDVSGL